MARPAETKLVNHSYVVIHSQPDGTWLAETPTYPMCKGEASTPDKALDALINSVTIHLTEATTVQ